MQTLWERIKKGFQTGVSVTVEKTEELSRIGRLKLDISGLKREMTRTFTQLGEEIYQKAAAAQKPELWEDEKVKLLIEKIDKLKAEIKNKEEELEQIRKEKEKRKLETKSQEKSAEEKNSGT